MVLGRRHAEESDPNPNPNPNPNPILVLEYHRTYTIDSWRSLEIPEILRGSSHPERYNFANTLEFSGSSGSVTWRGVTFCHPILGSPLPPVSTVNLRTTATIPLR
eukprot:1346789-Amorphochlora_amoeboformis.AAC.1